MKLSQVPLWAKIIPEVEDYIFENAKHLVGFTLDTPSSGDRFISYIVSKQGIEVYPWDVIATKRYMLNMGYLKELGYFDNLMTYTVKKEFRG